MGMRMGTYIGIVLSSNMGTHPQNREQIRQRRQQRAADGEPFNSESMSVRWDGDSLVIGLTAYGVKTHDITDDDELSVEVYPGGIWIDAGGGCNE
jgi:hypothetical protein